MHLLDTLLIKNTYTYLLTIFIDNIYKFILVLIKQKGIFCSAGLSTYMKTV